MEGGGRTNRRLCTGEMWERDIELDGQEREEEEEGICV